MITAVIVLIITGILSHVIVRQYRDQLSHSPQIFDYLFLYHTFFAVVYYTYAQLTRSDSLKYFHDVLTHERATNWLNSYGVGSRSIEFIAYPFVHYLNFSYEAVMLLFSFFGYLAFLYFYLFAVQKIKYKHKAFGVDLLVLFLFLPNMHFWSVSLGKGSIILLGICLILYGLGQFPKKIISLALGTIIVFHVRSHMLMIMLLALFLSMMVTSKGIRWYQKLFMLLICGALIVPVSDTFFQYIRMQEVTESSVDNFLEHRGSELTKATSGVAISQYNQAEKILTFLFRPLFVDSPNALGLIVSVENLLYIILFIRIVRFQFLRYLWQTDWLNWLCLFTFLGAAFALAQISGNMGLAIRQKSQIMFLFLVIILQYGDYIYDRYGRKLF